LLRLPVDGVLTRRSVDGELRTDVFEAVSGKNELTCFVSVRATTEGLMLIHKMVMNRSVISSLRFSVLIDMDDFDLCLSPMSPREVLEPFAA
jgi:hypothetical protein